MKFILKTKILFFVIFFAATFLRLTNFCTRHQKFKITSKPFKVCKQHYYYKYRPTEHKMLKAEDSKKNSSKAKKE